MEKKKKKVNPKKVTPKKKTVKKRGKKSNYKKMNKIITIMFVIIIIPLIGFLIYGLIPKNDTNSYNVYEDEGLDIYNDDTVSLYMSMPSSNVYLYNIKELLVKDKSREITFKEFLSKYDDYEDLFEDLEEYLDLKGELKDGGTKIYRTKVDNSLFKDSLSIIKCHTTDGNNDIYIGKNLNQVTAFKHGACGKNFFEDKEFSRTYQVIDIKVNDDNAILKLKDTNNKEVEVEYKNVSKETFDAIMATLEKSQKFNFYFKNKYGELIKEDPVDIFNNCELTKVEKAK